MAKTTKIRKIMHRDGREIPYSVVGEGTPLFIIGFGFYTYRLLSSRIKKAFQIVMADFYGLNQGTPNFKIESISLIEILKDINDLQLKLGFRKIYLLGHSSSGTVAIDYALSYPDLIEKAVLICSPDTYDSQYIEFQNDYTQSHLHGERKKAYKKLMDEFEEKKKKGQVRNYFVEFYEAQKPLYWFNYVRQTEDYWYDININQSFIENFVKRTYNIHERKTTLHDAKNEFVVFLGRYDYATPPNSWDKYAKDKNIKIHIMEKSGHYPMIEERDVFDDILLREIAT